MRPIAPLITARIVIDTLQAANVLRRRGILNPLRPDHLLNAARSGRRYGPFAAALTLGSRWGDSATAIVDELGILSYADLDAESNAVARGLAAQGISHNSVIGLLCRDHRGMVLSLLAAGKLGAKLVLLNTGFAVPQFLHVVKQEKISALLYDSEFGHLSSTLPPSVARVLCCIEANFIDEPQVTALDRLIDSQSSAPLTPPPRQGGLVLLTSGTTGAPKGAPREHISPIISAAQFLDRLPLPRTSTIVMAAPTFHGTGLSQLVLGLSLGNRIIMQKGKFDVETTLRNIADYNAEALVVVPTMLQRILDAPELIARYDNSALRVIFCAGSALSPDLCRRAAEAFGDVLYNLYGSTEVAVAAVATPQDLRQAPGTVGRVPVGCRVAVMDANRGTITEPGRVGTIFVSSGLSFTGYTDGRHKETVDGLLCSGDLGHFDDHGYLYVDGREDDMIVSGGENVYPLEIENLLTSRPDVLDAAVVGVNDREFGQRLRAFVVPAPSCERNPQLLRDYVKANLARYKAPRDVIFVDQLPRNATGKVLRGMLFDMQVATDSANPSLDQTAT
jgi:fatty-acyl-CoA synthase